MNKGNIQQSNPTTPRLRGAGKPIWKWLALGAIVLVLIIATLLLIKNIRIRNSGPNDGTPQTGFIPQASDKKPQQQEIQWPSVDAKYITALPLDLTQIESISKYRSCAGHDFSGYNFEQTLESNRTMKHYIFPTTAFQGTTDKVKMFAPFDGEVSKIDAESEQIGQPGKRPKTGNGIGFSTKADKNVFFEFSHIYFVKDFEVGDKITAGELIGYAALGEKGNDFDIVLSGQKNSQSQIFGSAFDHMTDAILAEFAKYGVTPENTKVGKEYRDANPCNYDSPDQSGHTGNDWLTLVK